MTPGAWQALTILLAGAVLGAIPGAEHGLLGAAVGAVLGMAGAVALACVMTWWIGDGDR